MRLLLQGMDIKEGNKLALFRAAASAEHSIYILAEALVGERAASLFLCLNGPGFYEMLNLIIFSLGASAGRDCPDATRGTTSQPASLQRLALTCWEG